MDLRWTERARKRAGGLAIRAMLTGLARGAALHPRARRAMRSADVTRDVPYLPSGLSEHRLDVWRPAGARGPLPTVLYVHGGAFRILSKETHWVLALAFVRQGYMVLSMDYRLAPRHRFPAAVEDVCAAWRWARSNAAAWGGDPDRMIVAGESAGGNLAAALAVATCFERPEPWARAASAAGRPAAVIPLCGVLQVSDMARFGRRKPLPTWLDDRIVEVEHGYLGPTPPTGTALDLADPLRVLERDEAPTHPLPPFFASVGTRDPLLDDTRRLQAALVRRRILHRVHFHPGEPHAFQALVYRPAARVAWRELFAFLDPLVR